MVFQPKEDFQPNPNRRPLRLPFPEDEYLRKCGFRIYSRPKKGPALWKRAGDIFTHEEAMALATMKGPSLL